MDEPSRDDSTKTISFSRPLKDAVDFYCMSSDLQKVSVENPQLGGVEH